MDIMELVQGLIKELLKVYDFSHIFLVELEDLSVKFFNLHYYSTFKKHVYFGQNFIYLDKHN